MFTPILWTELTGIDTTKLNDIENALYFLDNGYSKTVWDGSTGINTTRLQKIEDAIYAFDSTYQKTIWNNTRISTGKLQNINDGLCLALTKKPTITSSVTGNGSVDVGNPISMRSEFDTATVRLIYEIPLNTFNRLAIYFEGDCEDDGSAQSSAIIRTAAGILYDMPYGAVDYTVTPLVFNISTQNENYIEFFVEGEEYFYEGGCDVEEYEASASFDIYKMHFYNA